MNGSLVPTKSEALELNLLPSGKPYGFSLDMVDFGTSSNTRPSELEQHFYINCTVASMLTYIAIQLESFRNIAHDGIL